MADILLSNLEKIYDNGFKAVKGINLKIRDKEFMVLVGPSGCGKTTSLRMIAGLEDISAGEIQIDGRRVNDVQPKDRDIAMVFQNYALYPHMTVYDNMAYGLKLRRMPKDVIKEKVGAAAKMLNLTEQLPKRPKQLSGGQRQRVALGRAIVRQPKVFLFDEPLSNLDAKLRTDMRYELKTLQQRLQTTMVYVTHDQIEAMTLGDRITVMNQGHIMQVASPSEIYEQPANRFVASFIGTPMMNFLPGKLERAGSAWSFRINDKLSVRIDKPLTDKVGESAGKSLVLGVRPEHFAPVAAGTVNSIPTRVKLLELMGDHQYVYLECPGVDSVLIMKASTRQKLSIGEPLPIAIDTSLCHLFDGPGDEAVNLTLPVAAAAKS
jgi:multiple sugar transport system ATP-binding protein